MAYDDEALERKADELKALARQGCGPGAAISEEVADQLMESFVELTPPTLDLQGELIVVSHTGRTPGRTRKPGNIYLNWRKLMESIPDVTLAGTGAYLGPRWLLPFAALYMWNKLWRDAEESLSDEESTVMLALWKNRDGERKISEQRGLAEVNATRRELGLSLLTEKQYAAAIDRLIELECIELEEGIIWLREWVRITY